MGYEWIFDVLKDLKAFAQANGMPALAAKVDEALVVAAEEVRGLPEGTAAVSPQKDGTQH